MSIDTMQGEYYALQVFQGAEQHGADLQSPPIRPICLSLGIPTLGTRTARIPAPPQLSPKSTRLRVLLRCDKVYMAHGFMKHMT